MGMRLPKIPEDSVILYSRAQALMKNDKDFHSMRKAKEVST